MKVHVHCIQIICWTENGDRGSKSSCCFFKFKNNINSPIIDGVIVFQYKAEYCRSIFTVMQSIDLVSIAGFISSFVFRHFWRRSYQNQLSFSGKDSTADFFVFRHLRKTKMGWNAHKYLFLSIRRPVCTDFAEAEIDNQFWNFHLELVILQFNFLINFL